MPGRIGIDTGGTFTDCVHFSGRSLVVRKVRTTPDDPARGIAAGLAALGAPAGDAVVHGSTVATNAVLERNGARVALVMTAGFEDVLRIARQTRPELYSFFVTQPPPLVEPSRTFGLRERVDHAGAVLTSIEPRELDLLCLRLQHAHCEIVAVCLLHAYANPDHERQVAGRLRAAGLRVCASHEVLPEHREYERCSTTAVNAYVTPLVDGYLQRLERLLGGARLSIMQSNGGSIPASAARAQAVRTVLSGPAAGVIGARAAARRAGLDRVITFDMGGTSTDVSLVDGAIQMTTESRVGDFPVRMPMVDIFTVGAGGGSIARIDAGGALRVGPASAGADPGPACYGSGTDFTVTDANLLLGRLDPAALLGGDLRVDVDRARAAARLLGSRLGVSVDAVARAVIRVANSNMERAIRVVTLGRGHDPRRFALVAFGGAGPMHACELAAELGIRTVCVPKHAGVLSAFGMLVAPVRRDYVMTVLRLADALPPAELQRQAAPLIARAHRELAEDGIPPRRRRVSIALDLRYAGQSYEITMPWSTRYRAAFDREHARRYGYADPARPTEVVALRVEAVGVTGEPVLRRERPRSEPVAVRTARGTFGDRRVPTAFYRWPDLAAGARGAGAAVITGDEATVVIPPGWTFAVDPYGNIMARRRRAG